MNKQFLLLTGLCICLVACERQKGMVTTFAGTGKPDAINGEKMKAAFSNLMGLAADSSGNLYIADSRNNLIRKIAADGSVSTVAGSGISGSSDGKGRSASFFFPGAITIDEKGTLYIADTQNSMVRKISADGTVTTIAGRPSAAIEKKRDTVAKFNRPYGIAVDKKGNVYVSDWERDMIKKISPEGMITAFAGNGKKGAKDGNGAAATFYLPEGLTIDKKGNLYVADTYNNMIRKITPAGDVSTFAGRGTRGAMDGKGFGATFAHPDGLAADAKGNIYVADVGNNKIRKIKPDGTVTTLAGTGLRGWRDGPLESATFWKPFGIAIGHDGNLYVADYQNNLVRKIEL
jgi:sugar lactone lactonase YvrE